MLEKFIKILSQSKNLSVKESYDALMLILEGKSSTEEIMKILQLLADKGENVNEILGFAKAMREKAIPVILNQPATDNCGTGGTGKDRFNISTASSFVVATGGVPVAKHGNKGSRQANGSFDFLEELGIDYNHSPEILSQIFNQTNLCFIFARNHHPAMKYVVEARKKLARRSIFNIIGPLSNPAKVQFQIIGTTSQKIAKKIAFALQKLEIKKALVIVGGDGFDEITITSPSLIYEVSPTSISSYYFDPKTLGFNFQESDIKGNLAKENAELFLKILNNNMIDHPIAKMMALNAGASFYCFGKTQSIAQGFELAQELLKSGAVRKKFEDVKRVSHLIS